jgi:hypothetical protein
MQFLDNKMTKIGLIVAVSLVLIYLVKQNQKKMGADVSMIVMGLVVIGGLYAVFVVNSDEAESFQGFDNETLSDDSEYQAYNQENFTAGNNNAEAQANNAESAVNNAANNVQQEPDAAPSSANNVVPSEPLGDNEEPKSVEDMYSTSNTVPDQCYPKDVLTSAELLPKDTDSTWAQSVPAGQGSLTDQNFLNAGYHIGVNTVGQSLRNANRQLRSDPPCPQVKVSPWMQSTIEPDTNRRPLELGTA